MQDPSDQEYLQSMSEQPLYNSKIISIFVTLLKKKYPGVDVRDILCYAGITAYELSDEGHWLTQTQVDRFHTRMTQLVGADIAREGGRFATSREALGASAKYTLGLIGPGNTLLAAGRCASHFTRSARFVGRRVAENKTEITVTPFEGVQEKPYQCENRIGFFEAIVTMFDYDIPQVEHPECIFKGGSCCRYVVTWKKTRFATIRRARNIMIPLGLAVYALLQHSFGIGHFPEVLAGIAISALAASYVAERLEKQEILVTLANVKESTERTIEQIGMNYNNARMVNEVGQALSRQTRTDEVLRNVIGVIEKRLCYDRGVIMLADDRKSRLRFSTGFGYSDKQLEALLNKSFDLTSPGSQGVFVTAFRDKESKFVGDFSELEHLHSAQSVALSREMEAESFICCPIVCEGESLGIIAVDNNTSKRPLTHSDLSLLTGIAPVIGMSLRNAIYLEREQRMAEQIRQSQKMESVGVLAGGIAHDFNNLLTGMMGFVALAQMKLAQDDDVQPFLEQVMSAAEKAASLTRGLLAFSRKQVNHPEPVNLNQVVENVRKLLSRLVTNKISLNFELCDAMLPVVADSSQIDQLLTNLANNARDAMPEGGTLTIGTGSMEITEEWVYEHGFGVIGAYAVMTVTDTGVGMDEVTKSHVLEPFFTTKEVGKGSGLGLAIVYGIVKQHDGYLVIDSKPGEGTTFSILLPLIGGIPAGIDVAAQPAAL